jgi:hypothetical protein
MAWAAIRSWVKSALTQHRALHRARRPPLSSETAGIDPPDFERSQADLTVRPKDARPTVDQKTVAVPPMAPLGRD